MQMTYFLELLAHNSALAAALPSSEKAAALPAVSPRTAAAKDNAAPAFAAAAPFSVTAPSAAAPNAAVPNAAAPPAALPPAPGGALRSYTALHRAPAEADAAQLSRLFQRDARRYE